MSNPVRVASVTNTVEMDASLRLEQENDRRPPLTLTTPLPSPLIDEI